MEIFSRTASLIGEQSLEKLKNSSVAIFGVGGVGGYVLEALVRAGVGTLHVIDGDEVALSNVNRQILATSSTVGKRKVEVAKTRALDINPNANVFIYDEYFLPENANKFDFSKFDYVVDAIDMVTGKIALATTCRDNGVPLISSMGTGNKLDCTAFEVADIYQTSVCPLARVMRRELNKRGIDKLKVVYSKETPNTFANEKNGSGKAIPASISFVPSVAGLIIAGEVVKDIIGVNKV